MTEISSPKINFTLLAASLVLGMGAVVICWLTRMFLMKSPPDWLTFDYTVPGWILRIVAALIGGCSLVLALLARKDARKRAIRKFVYRTDVALSLIAIAFEIAVLLILFIVVVEFVAGALLKSVETPSLGCFGGSLDFFDLFDSDDRLCVVLAFRSEKVARSWSVDQVLNPGGISYDSPSSFQHLVRLRSTRSELSRALTLPLEID